MFINKIGYDHLEYGRNCQDSGFIYNNIKCVVDGCSEGLNSEVGAKLFCHLFKENLNIELTFSKLLNIFTTAETIKENILFTIIYVTEMDTYFEANICGDGYIVLQNNNDDIEYHKIDFANKPPYYAYNFFDKDLLLDYKNGVSFTKIIFDKTKYKKVGCASDGLRYILGNEDLKQEFEEYLKKDKETRIKLMINRECKKIKDDITIAF
jgi:hypothetical protein